MAGVPPREECPEVGMSQMGLLNMDGCEGFVDKDYTLLGQLRGG